MSVPTILVLAVGGNVSQGILKGLQHDGRPMRVLGADISPPQMGLYTVDKAFVAPWAHEPGFIPWLIDCIRTESVSVILSGAEPVLMALARHKGQIEAATGARVLCSAEDVMEIGDDKLLTCQWLEDNGLACPAYAEVSNQPAIEKLVARCGFPLIAKPRRGGGSRGLFEVQNQRDLAYIAGKSGYLLQESLGTENDEYTVGCFRYKDGTLAPSCCMKRELLAGTTYRASLGDFPLVRAEAARIVEKLRPLGPCNVQLRDTPRGPVCFEINPRFSGTTPIRSHFGYREVSAGLDLLLGTEPEQLPLITEGIALRYWNELYLDPSAHEALSQAGSMTPSEHGIAQIEKYGVLATPARSLPGDE